MAGPKESEIEYWHDSSDVAGTWEKRPPPKDKIHIPGIVHETSTLYMADDLEKDKHASVGPDYRPKGCGNVYVTGGALFPSSGSWNR